MKLLTQSPAVNGGEITPPEGLAPMFFSERTVRFVRAYCAAAGIDADEWAEGWIESHLKNAALTHESKKTPGKTVMEGIIYDILAPGHYRGIRSKKKALAGMLAVLESYRAEMDAENLELEAAASVVGGAE